MKLILSGDVGKYETELMGRDVDNNSLDQEDIQLVRFRTKMYDLSNGYVEVEGNSHLVSYDGKEYIIGEQGQDKSYDTSKTSLLHKLSCYTAITQYLEPGTKKNNIYMVLACPLSVLQVQEAKEEYRSYIQNDGQEVNINVNGKDYFFTIKEIMIKAEGSGIVYLEPKKFAGNRVGVVDLGGLNQGFSLYNDKVCKKEDRFIEECGTDRLIELVREQLSIYKKGNLIDAAAAEEALKEGGLLSFGKTDIESIAYVDKAKEIYYKEVMGNIKQHKFAVEQLNNLCFVGGTTTHIRDIITKDLPHAYIPENPQLATVTGLYKVAFKKYK